MSDPKFINPPPFGKVGDYSNLPNFEIGGTYQVNWTTIPSQEETNLWLIQDGDGLICEPLNLADTSCQQYLRLQIGSSWQWTVATPENYTTSNTYYWFSMTHGADNSGFFASHYFNILPQGSLPPSSTSSASASASATNSAATSPESTSSGISSGTKIAIGVSVGVGVPLLIILALIAFFLAKNARKRAAQRDSSQEPPFYSETPGKQSYIQTPQWMPPQQMAQPWSAPPQEMANTARSPQEMAHSTRSPQEMAANESDQIFANPSELSARSPHS